VKCDRQTDGQTRSHPSDV